MAKFMTIPCGWVPDSTSAENEIRQIFYHHWEKMRDQLVASVNEINSWRQKSFEEINKYVDEQIQNLGKDYDRLRLTFDGKCEENLDTTRAYYSAQNIELFNELRDACRSLEFQVAQLEYIINTISTPKVVTVEEQIERKKKEQSNASKSEEKLLIDLTDNMPENHSENGDISVKLEPPISNQTYSHSLTVASSNDNSQLPDNNNDSQTQPTTADDSINKCPICFMIFPLSMSHDDRSRHVNEHCTDD